MNRFMRAARTPITAQSVKAALASPLQAVRNAGSLLAKAFSWPSGDGDDGGGLGSVFGSESSAITHQKWTKVHRRNSLIRGPVNLKAELISLVPIHLFRKDGLTEDGQPKRVEVHEHQALSVLRKPNPYMTFRKWKKLGVTYLEHAGTFANFVERGDGEGKSSITTPGLRGKIKCLPVGLWPIRPRDIINWPSGKKPWWDFDLRGKKFRNVPIQDVIWTTYTDPDNPYGQGVGASEAVADDVAINGYCKEWQANQFRKGLGVRTLVVIPGLTSDAGDELENDFRDKAVGSDNGGGVFFAGGGEGTPTITQLDKSHRELEYSQGMRDAKDTCRQNWYMPPELLGDNKSSNRATTDAACNLVQRNVVAPGCVDLDEFANVRFLPMFGEPDLYFESDNPIEETQDFKLQQATTGVKSTCLSVNEWRVAQGWPRKEGWDVYILQAGTTLIGENGEILVSNPGANTPGAGKSGGPESPVLEPQLNPPETTEDSGGDLGVKALGSPEMDDLLLEWLSDGAQLIPA